MAGISTLDTVLKKLTEIAMKQLTPWISSVLVALGTYLGTLWAELNAAPKLIGYLLIITAILTGITVLALTSLLRMYLTYSRFQEAYGSLWDKDFNMRCMSCKKPLKPSSQGTFIYYCADPACNSKHILKDSNGVELTKQAAIDLIKSSV